MWPLNQQCDVHVFVWMSGGAAAGQRHVWRQCTDQVMWQAGPAVGDATEAAPWQPPSTRLLTGELASHTSHYSALEVDNFMHYINLLTYLLTTCVCAAF